jgi:hypothetical protein
VGFYIEVPQDKGKAEQMIQLHGAVSVFVGLDRRPPRFDETPEGLTLLCVVENPGFDAVGIVYDEHEYRVFADPTDARPKTWLLIPDEKARELCPRYARFAEGG